MPAQFRIAVVVQKHQRKSADHAFVVKPLEQALKEGNVKEAFRAAHTLKGVCQNLGFTNQGAASEGAWVSYPIAIESYIAKGEDSTTGKQLAQVTYTVGISPESVS